jgi:hypothetical protein
MIKKLRKLRKLVMLGVTIAGIYSALQRQGIIKSKKS